MVLSAIGFGIVMAFFTHTNHIPIGGKDKRLE